MSWCLDCFRLACCIAERRIPTFTSESEKCESVLTEFSSSLNFSSVPAAQEWCHQHGVRDLKDGYVLGLSAESGPLLPTSAVARKALLLQEIQTRWEEILQELKFKTAKEQLPGKRVSVRVLKGKWQGSYMAQAPGFDNHRYPASAYV